MESYFREQLECTVAQTLELKYFTRDIIQTDVNNKFVDTVLHTFEYTRGEYMPLDGLEFIGYRFGIMTNLAVFMKFV